MKMTATFSVIGRIYLGALCVLLLILANVTISVAWDQGDSTENVIDGKERPRDNRLVQFQSEYDEALNLYWIGDKLDKSRESQKVTPVLIAEILPRGTVDVNTFDFHLFYASRVTDNVRAIPRKVTISPVLDLYVFHPDGVRPNSDKSEGALTAETKPIDRVEPVKPHAPVSKAPIANSGVYESRNRDHKVNNGLHPAVTLLHSSTQAMSVKFKTLTPCDYYYDDGRDGIYQGRLRLGGESTTNTYEGHVFYFTRVGKKDSVLARFTMNRDTVTYVVTDPKSLPPRHLQEQVDKEKAFTKSYRERTGLHWRHYYGPDGPRPPPILHMWEAQSVGQVHRVESTEGHWMDSCPNLDVDTSSTSKGAAAVAADTKQPSYLSNFWGKLFGEKATEEVVPLVFPKHTDMSKAACQSKEMLPLELEVISLEPRAFVIENFLSHFEADEIVRISKDKLKESTVGNGDAGGARSDGTRTSKNTWLSRETNSITESLFLRASDILQIDQNLLRSTANAEDMQVVNYVDGQKYDSHHDWGVSGYPESRFITLLLYLTDQPSKTSGGETAFPKAAGGGGMKVHPGKGNAVLFYNLLEDGNGDDLALHAALPVKDGHEKWLANYWVWDAKRR